jgi:methyl-accepting chemotaxis protein
VVAEEVRKLAITSRTAADEVTRLAVTNGTTVARSGVMLRQLVPAMRDTATVVKTVAAASAEQAAGLDQVGREIGQVEAITRRNSAAAEKLAAMADEMSSHADSLRAILTTFRGTEQAAPAIASRTDMSLRLVGRQPTAVQRSSAARKAVHRMAAAGRSADLDR